MDVLALARDLRNIIFEFRLKSRKLMLRRGWQSTAGALDVIETCELAIRSFDPGRLEKMSRGEAYLSAMGLLEALSVQQYAIRHLSASLGMQEDPIATEKLKHVRSLRQFVVFEKGEVQYLTFAAVTSRHLKFWRFADKDRTESDRRPVYLSYRAAVEGQSAAAGSTLSGLLDSLREEAVQETEREKAKKEKARANEEEMERAAKGALKDGSNGELKRLLKSWKEARKGLAEAEAELEAASDKAFPGYQVVQRKLKMAGEVLKEAAKALKEAVEQTKPSA